MILGASREGRCEGSQGGMYEAFQEATSVANRAEVLAEEGEGSQEGGRTRR